MKIRNPKSLIVIIGPTAIGKTPMAIHIAKMLDTEIISADSRQFYQEMSIGTAKPSEDELKAVKHHFIDSHSIHESFTAADFEREGLELLSNLFKKKDVIILAGGSGLYINALCNGFDELPEAAPEIREQLNRQLEEHGIEALRSQLKKLDPEYYKKVDLSNSRRLIRALEVCISAGKPFSSYHFGQKDVRPFNIIKIGLNTDRKKLYERIDFRVDQMMEMGLANEAKKLLPYRHLNALNTVGYTELFDFFDGEISLEKAVAMIKQNTRRFAKRQLTWFRKDPEIKWFEPEQYQEIEKYVLELVN